jgi:RimJ/RimL family protein N-acetyltransferase
MGKKPSSPRFLFSRPEATMSPTDTPPNTPFSARPGAPAPLFGDLARDDVFRLETSRLWLRWPRLSDAGALLRLAGEKRVAEMTSRIPHPYPANGAEPAIFEARKGNALGEAMTLAIARKETPDRLIGMMGIRRDEEGLPLLECWLGLDHWGNGLATEATQAMIDAAFTLSGADALTARARLVNPASRRVLEKCGFRHDGSRLRAMPARGGVYPCDEFRLDRKTWASLRNWAALKSWSGETAGEADRLARRADLPQLVVG